MQNKKWTIGIVNFHTIEFIKYQLEILYNNNPNTLFDVFIIDNSNESEVDELKTISCKYPNVNIIRNEASKDPWMRGSGQHGEGLDLVLDRTETEYLLVHDPDFFWVGDNYLDSLEKYLSEGNLAVGAPYRNFNGFDETGGIGPIDYPAAFGAAYKVSSIKSMSFLPLVDKDTFEKSSGACWLKVEGADVGWEMRKKLGSYKYKSFSQKPNQSIACLGSYSFEAVPYEYYIDDKQKPIAFHLFRGSFGEDISSVISFGTVIKSDSIKVTRERFGHYFSLLAKLHRDKSFKNQYNLIKFIFPYKFPYQGSWLDTLLHHLLYKPLVYTSVYFYKTLKKSAQTLEKVLYVFTHPVGFIKNKLDR